MSVQVENLEKNMAKLTIEVSAEDLEKALESAYQKQKKQISVPGFRKGKEKSGPGIVPRLLSKVWANLFAHFLLLLHDHLLDHFSTNRTCLFGSQIPIVSIF